MKFHYNTVSWKWIWVKENSICGSIHGSLVTEVKGRKEGREERREGGEKRGNRKGKETKLGYQSNSTYFLSVFIFILKFIFIPKL